MSLIEELSQEKTPSKKRRVAIVKRMRKLVERMDYLKESMQKEIIELHIKAGVAERRAARAEAEAAGAKRELSMAKTHTGLLAALKRIAFHIDNFSAYTKDAARAVRQIVLAAPAKAAPPSPAARPAPDSGNLMRVVWQKDEITRKRDEVEKQNAHLRGVLGKQTTLRKNAESKYEEMKASLTACIGKKRKVGSMQHDMGRATCKRVAAFAWERKFLVASEISQETSDTIRKKSFLYNVIPGSESMILKDYTRKWGVKIKDVRRFLSDNKYDLMELGWMLTVDREGREILFGQCRYPGVSYKWYEY
jgi:hypothetical protein